MSLTMHVNRELSAQLVKYLGASVSGTALHYLLLASLVHGAGVRPVPASTCGAMAGAMMIYGLNYFITFRSTKAHGPTMARFLPVAGLGLIINGIAQHVALNRLAWPLAPSQMVATMLQFSAAFYSRSEAVTVRTPDDAEHFFTNGTLDYFVVDAGRFAQLPKDFQTRLSEVRRINNYYLLKEKYGDIL